MLGFDGGIAQRFGDGGFDGLGPELEAFGAGVFEVGHEVFGDRAVGVEEDFINVQVEDVLVVGEFRNDVVCLGEFDLFVVGFFAAEEDAEEKDFGIGEFLAQEVDDVRDTFGDFFGGVMRAVVLADHNDSEFGVDTSFKVAVLEPPEDVFGAVTPNAEVHGVALGIVNRLSAISLQRSVIGNGNTEKHR
ncbi:MAG TPA: hypothetical protein PLI09_28230 [Candidatus Hydrogenedentes bacterium]|nr:hypothetical protein [Candidatus Hydrogenedentota bacterium]